MISFILSYKNRDFQYYYAGPYPTRVQHFPKTVPTAPSAFPLLGAPQAPGDEPNPPEGSKSLGEDPLRPKEISKIARSKIGQ